MPPLPPTSPAPLITGVVCTTCMNVRDPANMCRESWQPCVLDPPSYEDWQASGRGGNDEGESRRLFDLANASFTAGLEHRRGDSSDYFDACRYGHTDHVHTHNASSVGACRPLYLGDTCTNPIPTPFVCACIAEPLAFTAQDEIGQEPRFWFMLIGLACVCLSFLLLLLNLLFATRDYLRRRFWHGGLRYAAQSTDEGKAKTPYDKLAAADRAAALQVRDELDGLWQCVSRSTCLLALILGPFLVYVAFPQEPAYYVGCGFRIPEVIIARSEFAGANAAG